MKADIVGVIEAAYLNEPDDVAWLRALAEVASPGLAQGFGVSAAMYRFSADGHVHIGPIAVASGDPSFFESIREGTSHVPPPLVARMFKTGPSCSSASSLMELPKERWESLPVAGGVLAPRGAFDTMGVTSGDPRGRGCILMAPKRRWGPVPRATAYVWSRVAAHLAAAYRLRRRLSSPAEPPDAVLSPSGRLEHAEPHARDAESRESLTEGARRIERARGSLRRRQPHEAVDVWRALVAGRWSLIDHFDHDGRRFLLARRNDPFAAVAASLSTREREVLAHAALGHSNKFIAYELGVSASSVAMHLSRAARKLRVHSRVELIAAYRRGRGDASA